MLAIKDYTYDLPKELIAHMPANKREDSRLMILNRVSNSLSHSHFYSLPEYLSKGDLLVFNDTRVIPARLFGKKESGANIEVFLLEEIDPGIWEVLVRPAVRVKLGNKILFDHKLTGEVFEVRSGGKRLIKFDTEELNRLKLAGKIPLPPYIKYENGLENFYQERYQTIFSRKEGAVAAPTAGLHFSDELLKDIDNKGIETCFLTLHVGIGTFRPIKHENVLKHEMHSERYILENDTVQKILETKRKGHRVIAVGTTVTRVLEGVFKKYDQLEPGSDKINVFIYPGFEYKVIDGMITNFHLPKSSLLLMVSAFTGRDFLMDSYQVAIRKKYRFYSFGDGMLVL